MLFFARRSIRPMPPIPANISSKVEGSGAAETEVVAVIAVPGVLSKP